MTAPQGSNSFLAWGFEKQLNLWMPSRLNKFLPAKFAGMMADRPLVRSSNLSRSGQTRKGSNLEAHIQPKWDWEPSVDEIVPLLCHMDGTYSFGAQVGGGGGPYPFTATPRLPGDAANANYVESIFAVASDDDGYPVLNSGIMFQDLTYKIDKGKISMLSLGGFGCFDSFSGDATILQAGSSGKWDGLPILRGHWDATKSGPLKIKVTAAAAGGFDGTVKMTTGTYAGSTTVQIKFNTPVRVTLDDASRLGINRYEDLWVIFPSSGTKVLEINQEWSIPNQRVLPVPDYSSQNALHIAGVEITIDGVEFFLQGLDVKRTRPRKEYFTNGSKYSREIQNNGEWKVTLSIDRQREDRQFVTKLLAGQTISVITNCYGDPFGTYGYDQLWKAQYPHCQVAKDPRDVQSGGVLEEKIDLEVVDVDGTAMFTDSGYSNLNEARLIDGTGAST